MTAIGGPLSRRPLAEATSADERLRPFDEAAYKAARRRFFERFSTARQTRIGHEIFVGVEGFFARGRLYARGTAVRQELPALLVVLEISHHNLAENLFVHGRIENRTKHLDPAVEVTRHHVRRGNIYCRLRVRQRVSRTKAIDAAVLEEPANDRFHANVFRQPGHSRPQAADAANDKIDGNPRS